jgi:hypothetical protein
MSKRVSVTQRVQKDQHFKGDKVFLPDEDDVVGVTPVAPVTPITPRHPRDISLDPLDYVWEKFRLTREQSNKIYSLAQKQGRTTSELVREALDYYLANR